MLKMSSPLMTRTESRPAEHCLLSITALYENCVHTRYVGPAVDLRICSSTLDSLPLASYMVLRKAKSIWDFFLYKTLAVRKALFGGGRGLHIQCPTFYSGCHLPFPRAKQCCCESECECWTLNNLTIHLTIGYRIQVLSLTASLSACRHEL